jgi:hypothetical protein
MEPAIKSEINARGVRALPQESEICPNGTGDEKCELGTFQEDVSEVLCFVCHVAPLVLSNELLISYK